MQYSNINFSPDKFKCFVRYLIQAAKDKRCVTYKELENLFGLSHKQAGHYAGKLGDYCLESDLPALNGLIISSTQCVPSEGFNWYQEQFGMSWGELVSKCWKYFHVTSTREKQVQDFSGLDSDISNFLGNGKK
ncbi:MAG: hypothetical protein D8M58_16705 [Calditrichaeota bacterium]|nr:MAG: hypothetical protein DWQ03_08435 [Calditrichota bacterium]MBL1207047.1 hypothetical protein [Calditrichota bacterium]NOG46875.1 hypothetical protein [Calditrichota bacterium]